MSAIQFDNRLTIGNLLTIAGVLITCIFAISTFRYNSSSNTERIALLEQNQTILEQRIGLVEKELDAKQTSINKLQEDIQRTVTYMQLLLDKEGIQYVK